MKTTGSFVIRVYGLFVNNENKILLSDEYQVGRKMTKFPGGGLEFGEGLIDGLKREIREECNGQEIKEIKHFYTTDFYQKALFYSNHQLISIYYLAKFVNPLQFTISSKPFDFKKMENGNQSFRWVSISQLSEDELSFPIDKTVAGKLVSIFGV